MNTFHVNIRRCVLCFPRWANGLPGVTVVSTKCSTGCNNTVRANLPSGRSPTELELMECEINMCDLKPYFLPCDIHHSSESKQDKFNVTNFKRLPNIQILKFCKELYTRHTFLSCWIRCINMKWITKNCRRYRADTGCGTDGRTDGPHYLSIYNGNSYTHKTIYLHIEMDAPL